MPMPIISTMEAIEWLLSNNTDQATRSTFLHVFGSLKKSIFDVSTIPTVSIGDLEVYDAFVMRAASKQWLAN